MTKREEGEQPRLHANQVIIRTAIDGRPNQQPPFDRRPAKERSVKSKAEPEDATTSIIPASVRIAGRAILSKYRKEFGLTGPDSDYLEWHSDGTLTVHHNTLWRQRRSAVKRPPTLSE